MMVEPMFFNSISGYKGFTNHNDYGIIEKLVFFNSLWFGMFYNMRLIRLFT